MAESKSSTSPQIDSGTHNEYDIVIVGAGLVGATLALNLAKDANTCGLRVALIEASDKTPSVDEDHIDPRVVALSNSSIELLHTLDVWHQVREMRLCPYYDMHVWDAEGTGEIHFSCDDIYSEYLGFIVENSVLQVGLFKALSQEEKVTLKRGVSVKGVQKENVTPQYNIEPKAQLALSDGTALSAKLIIAADGASSKMRELSGIETRQWSYGQSAIVTTVETEKSHEFCAWQRFTDDGPLAFLPLTRSGKDSNTSSIVWSHTSELADEHMALSDDEFKRVLEKAFESRLGQIIALDKRFCIQLNQRHAKTYYSNQLALIGDAAHSIHPLAGQGVNLGLYDVACIANEISRACKRNISLTDSSILKRYERQRMPHNLMAMGIMEGFKRLFGANQLAVRWLRNTGLQFCDEQKWIKKQLVKMASGQ